MLNGLKFIYFFMNEIKNIIYRLNPKIKLPMVKKYTSNLQKDFHEPKVKNTSLKLLVNYSKSIEIKKSKEFTFFVINN